MADDVIYSTKDYYTDIRENLPGVKITSGFRTPEYQEDMRRRGYKPAQNSGHLEGGKLDLVPPAGKDYNWLRQEINTRYPEAHINHEGDHFDVTFPGYNTAPALGGAAKAGISNPHRDALVEYSDAPAASAAQPARQASQSVAQAQEPIVGRDDAKGGWGRFLHAYKGNVQYGFPGLVARKVFDWTNTGMDAVKQAHPNASPEELEQFHDAAIAESQKTLRENYEAESARDPAWRPDESWVDNILSGRWAAAIPGIIGGQAGPEMLIAPGGGSALRNIGVAAASNAAADAAYQGLDINDNVADEFNPMQALISAGAGAGLQGLFEGVAKLGKGWKALRNPEGGVTVTDDTGFTTSFDEGGKPVVSPDGTIVVNNTADGSSLVFDPSGQPLRRVGPDGSVAEETPTPQMGTEDWDAARAPQVVDDSAPLAVGPDGQLPDLRRDFNTIENPDGGGRTKTLPNPDDMPDRVAAGTPETLQRVDGSGKLDTQDVTTYTDAEARQLIQERTGQAVPVQEAEIVQFPERVAAPEPVPVNPNAPDARLAGNDNPNELGLDPRYVEQPRAGDLPQGVEPGTAANDVEELPLNLRETPGGTGGGGNNGEPPAGGGYDGGGTPPPSGDVVARLTAELNNAKDLRVDQKRLYRDARRAKLDGVAAAQKVTGGREGLYAEKAALAGEMPKVRFEGVEDKFSPEEITSLFDTLKTARNLSPFESIRAREGLDDLLTGKLPTPSDLNLLNRVFGDEFTKAAMKHNKAGSKVLKAFADLGNLPFALMSSFDLGGMFRQGAFMVTRPEFWKAAPKMASYLFSKKSYNALMQDIYTRPSYHLMDEHGLAFSDLGSDLTRREENFASDIAKKIPGIKASERVYSGFLNKLRADVFDSMLRDFRKAGFNPNDEPELLRDAAKYINDATGRGNLGRFTKYGPAMNALLFSPRLMASRINLIKGALTGFHGYHPQVRKQAIRDLAGFGGVVSTTLALASMAGADIETDPRSTDFAKIKDGNTRHDILAGFQQYIRLAAQLATGEKKTIAGDVQELGKGFGKPTRLDQVITFFRTKGSPVATFVADYLDGQNVVGEPFEVQKALIERLTPMSINGFKDAYDDQGFEGIVKSLDSLFGIGVQTYAPKESNKVEYSNEVEYSKKDAVEYSTK